MTVDLSKKFEYNEKDDCTRFMGDKLIIRVPDRYVSGISYYS